MANREQPPGASGPGEFEVVTEDVIEQRRRDEQTRHVRKLAVVGQLAGGVAHTFNNLLTSILGFTEILLSPNEPGTDNRALKEIDQAARRAATLTRQLLAFAGETPGGANERDVSRALRSVCNLMASLTRSNIEIAFEALQCPATVRVDMNQIEQAVVHLILHAQDALGDGGRILVSLASVDVPAGDAMPPREDPGPWVRIRVSHTGVGMPVDIRHQFKCFFATPPPDGVGLGLWAVCAIARQSGGCVGVDAHQERGTTISLYFPSVEARPGVLVVDDDLAVRTIAERILRARGFAVFGAASAAAAIALFEREPDRICVLVSDLRLQGMSGQELARALFARRADLAVVFITGGAPLTQAGDDLKRAALLSKPFDAPGLVSAVQRVIESRLARG